MPKLEFLPAVAGGLGIVSLSTLVFKVHQTSNTTSFPYSWLFINLTAQILSLIYALANKAWGIYVPNTIFILGLSYMLFVKVFKEAKTAPSKKAGAASASASAAAAASASAPSSALSRDMGGRMDSSDYLEDNNFVST